MAKYLSLLLVAAVALSRFEMDAATGEGVHEDVVEEEDASTNSSPFGTKVANFISVVASRTDGNAIQY